MEGLHERTLAGSSQVTGRGEGQAMSEIYQVLLWLKRIDNEMDKFVREHETGNNLSVDVPSRDASRRGDDLARSGSPQNSLSMPNMQASPSWSSLRAHGAQNVLRNAVLSEPEARLRITEAPEPHEPTKVLGWLLVGFAGFCVYVLGATIFKFWPVIVRTLR
jgi:hypothetical protein